MSMPARQHRRQRLSELKHAASADGWQALKSELTRSDTLDAAIRCF